MGEVMRMNRRDVRGGIEAALRGWPSTVAPVLLFMAMFGPQSLAAGFWATVVTAILVPAVNLLFKGQSAVIPGARLASLAAYIWLVISLTITADGTLGHAPQLNLTTAQLKLGLAAGSLMFLIASALVLLCGLLKFGNVFKMIPMPVTAGISNGTALLLFMLAFHKLSGSNRWATATAAGMVGCFFLWPRLQAWRKELKQVPGVVAAVVLGLVITVLLESPSQSSSAWVTPDWSWISVRLWPELPQHDFIRLLKIGLPGVMTLSLVMILETFTAANEMEQRFGVRINPNHELMVLGGSNMVSALLGGVPCTGHNSRSIASWVAGGRGIPVALAGLIATGILLTTLSGWLLTLSSGLIAGILLLQCFLMSEREFFHRLVEIVRTQRLRRPGTSDLGFWTTVVISIVEFFGNMIWACFMGIGLSCLVILRRVSGSLTTKWNYLDRSRSRRVRTFEESKVLTQQYHRIGILRLNGHLFFGNSIRLTQLVDELNPGAVATVIDVSHVIDVDPSGLDSLVWLIRALVERQLTVVLTGLNRPSSPELSDALQALQGVHRCTDVDRGLELCEDQVLLTASAEAVALLSMPLKENSLLEGLTEDETTAVLMLGQPREVASGEVLFFKGSEADGVWLLEKGAVSILSGGDGSTRLSTLGPGQFFGEMSLIDGKPRSATAQADSAVSALLLDKDAIAAMTIREPEATLKIMRNIAKYLSYRIRSTSALLAEEVSEPTADFANSSLSTFS